MMGTRSARKPNLIYIFADQWRRQAAGFMKEDEVDTPNIDRFAEEGLVFTQAISCTPLCSPHRSSLMTGKYAQSTGVYTNCKIGLDVMLSPDEIGIGDALKQGGYKTGYIGKWHLDLPEQNVSESPASGAKNWDAYTPPGAKRQGFDYWYSYGTFDEHLTPHYWMDTPEQLKVNQWSVEHETNKAMDYIETRYKDEAPFSLFLSWNPPHSPFELVPERYKEKYAGKEIVPRANVTISDPFLVHTGETIPGGEERWQQSAKDYFAAITGIDEQFGRLMEQLERLGIADHTIVVLTSDHGELLGSHGMMAKHSWHEESIGVPFIVRWPEGIAAGVTDEVLNTVDIMPTLLDLLELPIPDSVQGSSIAPLIVGEHESGSAEMGPIAGEARSHSDVEASQYGRIGYISAFPGRMEAIRSFKEAGLSHLAYGWRGVRTNQYTYVVDKGYFPGLPTRRMLYDLQSDPYQLNPLYLEHSSEHPAAEHLEKELAKLLTQTKDTFEL